MYIYGTAALLKLFLTFPKQAPIATFENVQIYQNASTLTSVNINDGRLHLLQPYKLPYFGLLHVTNELSFICCMGICFKH
jgi:hypothetical protein